MYNRYFIAHIANKRLAEYHHRNTKDLARKFNLLEGSGFYPSHITLKAPFEATNDEISAVKWVLQKITKDAYSPPFVAQGFGHFGRRILTIDVVHSIELEILHLRLIKGLESLPFVKWRDHEPITHLHLTIAKGAISEKFDEIWEYLKQQETPAFHCRLDNIAILRFENGQWVVDETYQLNP